MQRREPFRLDLGGGLIVRPTRVEDVEWVLGAEAAPAQRPFVTQWTRDAHQQALTNEDRAHGIIEDGGDLIGYVILAGLAEGRSIELVRIVVTRPGRGIGRRVLRAIERHAFDVLGAHRLWLDVFTHNDRALGLYRSEGFVEEGTLRECVWRDGAYRSLTVLSMLDREYHAKRGDKR